MDVSVSHVWYASLAHADHLSVKWMAEKDIVRDTEMRRPSIMDDCSLCVRGTLVNTLVMSGTHVEVRPEEMINTDAAVINVRSIS